MKIVSFLRNYALIIFIWLSGLFLRCYRQAALLGFYYDQGRDAQIATDIIAGRNFPAIGPTTGINGLYLGPFWYYLITPGYFIGQGNPAIASYFISFLESLTIPLIFFLVKTWWRLDSAYLASIIWAYSHYLVRSARWFSNPSPLPTFVLLIMFVCLRVINKKEFRLLPLLAILLALSLQLEAASAVFFFPVLILFFLLNHRQWLNWPRFYWLKSLLAFVALLLPQVVFEVKNHFILSQNLLSFLVGRINTSTGKTWSIPDYNFIISRLLVYYQSFFSKLDTNLTLGSMAILSIFLLGLLYLLRYLIFSPFIKLQILWLFLPLFILLFFSGNYGILYDYYLTGLFPAFVILVSVIFTLPKNKIIYFTLLFGFAYLFYRGNYLHLKNYLSADTDGPLHITLGNELLALDYLCQKRQIQDGNLDIYVPPVIPHSYNYLISWRQKHHLCPNFSFSPNKIVYLIYEVDPHHPERLINWLDRYKADSILDIKQFGGVFVQMNRRKIN